MATRVIMPALEMAQDTGKVVRWLKAPGERVSRGEPIVEIETDKVTVEIEAAASGILGEVTAQAGDVVPVGQTIAMIVEADGAAPARRPAPVAPAGAAPAAASPVKASPLARKIAEQRGVDLADVRTSRGRIEKADVLAHLERGAAATIVRLPAASPKARRLAAERGIDLHALRGSGPSGAVLAGDVPAVAPVSAASLAAVAPVGPEEAEVGRVWRIMAERMTASWTSAPHFYLVREVDVSRLAAWREHAAKRTGVRITYTDLLVKLAAATLTRHPGVNASWQGGRIARNAEINVGLAVAVEAGLVVPVVHRADLLSVAEIAARREDVVSRSHAGTLRPADIQGGGFTISNLGMYGVDAFDAIVNPPQAAILSVGRIADRVVAAGGQPAVRPTVILTLSCDHRALDGARGARFLGDLAAGIEEPLTLLG